MNVEVYTFGLFANGYSQFPSDYTEPILKKFFEHAKAPTQIAIRREGNIMYYGYIRKLDDGCSIGICAAMNGSMLQSVNSLFKMFENVFTGLVSKGDLVKFNEQGNIVAGVNQLSLNGDEVAQLADSLRVLFERQKSVALPSENYGISKDSVKDFVIGESDNDEIVSASVKYGYTYIYKNDKFDTPQLSGYRTVVTDLSKDKKALETKCNELAAELAKAKAMGNQQNGYSHKAKLWIIGLAICAIFVVVCILLSISSVNHYQEYKTSPGGGYIDSAVAVVDSAAAVAPEEAPDYDYEIADEATTYVVVNGHHVRLRWGPSLNDPIYSNSHGHAIYPHKGEKLIYLGTDIDFYRVLYDGNELYISSDYSYIE
ncbi:MAG: hypothetical protein KBT10_02305 [Bacteroidales bacterium]|nr:hypothetical protein [Candidatus Sodaliphilus aphodohippi]